MASIKSYYSSIASEYDADRFGNSYGRYLHAQEWAVLKKWLPGPEVPSLDLACGTGRFSSLTQCGADLSEAMLEQARAKHPGKDFYCCDASQLPFENEQFDLVLSMHLFMHLTENKAGEILDEVHRVLRPGGRFVLDFPSRIRRDLLQTRKPTNWHGSTAYTPGEFVKIRPENWSLKRSRGLLFFPIHRLPDTIRPAFRPLDSLICASPIKALASYQLIELEKR
jgi:ubiquinone/menaquinone biosynthesis C-methylase UbiE